MIKTPTQGLTLWTGRNTSELKEFSSQPLVGVDPTTGCVVMRKNDGNTFVVEIGEFIIKDADGEIHLYPKIELPPFTSPVIFI